MDGLNVELTAPFKFQDYVVGFKYAISDLKRAPESFFARRKFDTAGDSSVNVNGDYNLAQKVRYFIYE